MAPTRGSPPLRVAWFGHACGSRADGLSTYTRQTVEALVGAGAEVLVVHHSSDGSQVPEGTHGVAVASRSFKTLAVDRRASWRQAQAAVEEFQPDVVHLSLSFSLHDAAIAGLGRRVGAATVVTCHLPLGDAGTRRSWIMGRLYRHHARTINRCDRCIALGGDQRDQLRRAGVAERRLTVLHNAVDVERFHPGHSRLRGSIGRGPVVGYIGRIDPEKRVGALVDAFRALEDPAARLLLVGAGSSLADIRARGQGDPRISLVGQVSDPAACADLYRAIDVFVLPSAAEGLSLSLLEAMASGCAVIATDTGDDRVALGDAGTLLDAGRPLRPQLDSALTQMLGDPERRARLAAAARVRAEQAFSLSRYVEQLMEIYSSLRGERPAVRHLRDAATPVPATAD